DVPPAPADSVKSDELFAAIEAAYAPYASDGIPQSYVLGQPTLPTTPKLDSALVARADRTQWTKKPTVPSWNAGSTGPGFGGALHINDNDIDVGASQAGTSFALAVVDWTFASSALLSGNRFTNLSLYVPTALVVMKRVVVTGSLIVNYAA